MPEGKKPIEKGKLHVSRREFLKDAGIIAGGAALGSVALVNACGGKTTVTAPGTTITKSSTVTSNATSIVTTTVAGPGGSLVTVTSPVTITKVVEVTSTSIQDISFTINGDKYQKAVPANATLQELLHDNLGFTSIKDWCLGNGACGSCSVIVNGRPVLACLTLAALCNGATIETAEGIGKVNHPIIDAMVVNHAVQCGYCAPGIVVTAKALLDRNPDPTEQQIREALGGNLCRCGTYPRLIPAIKTASAKLKGGK